MEGGWVGWLDQMKIRLTSAMAFVELGLGLSFATNILDQLGMKKRLDYIRLDIYGYFTSATSSRS